MRKIVLLIGVVVALSLSGFGQVFRVQKWCELGAQGVFTQGLQSTTLVQRSFPQCQVTVYLTGTLTLAPIYSDNLATPTPLSNPFTANTNGSWGFFAPTGCYDVVTAGGISPNQLPSPFTYSSICIGQGGSGGTVSCSSALFGSMAAFVAPPTLSCDPSMGTDFNGNGFSQSWKTLGPFNGYYGLIGGGASPGTNIANKLSTNEFRWLATTLVTPYYMSPPPTLGVNGQVIARAGQTTDANGDPVITTSWQNGAALSLTATSPIVVTPSPITGVGVVSCPTCGTSTLETQTNGVDNTSQSILNLKNSTTTFDGYQVTHTNTSAGNVQLGVITPNSQITPPSTPTLANQNAAGARSITYQVQACEDGPTCARHTTVSTQTIANANASPQVLLSGYGDTLANARCFDVYVTADSGARTGVPGRAYNCVGKKVIDTGGNGNSVAATNTNTTVLVPSYGAYPPCAYVSTNPTSSVDYWPCTPNASDDEFGWSGITCAGANDGVWTWVNQNGATCTMSLGMLVLTSSLGADQLSCIVRPIPATPFKIRVPYYYNISPNGNALVEIAFRESATGKIVVVSNQTQNSSNSMRIGVGKWTNATTNSSLPVAGSTASATNPGYFGLQYDGTTTTYEWSPSGVTYTPALAEAKNAFFTTAPDQYGLCVEPATGTIRAEYDYERAQ